ncbi:hypothetical protein [Streptomyces sp. EN16]|uniref:hypothetical protein n=1 Tax=Streptomyces sp. EN16 TaxID=212773 RepID=UPI000851746F|nr:hypothetical protein [Streptomyces sp. EN16]
MRQSFTVFTDEGVELSEVQALMVVLNRCAAHGHELTSEPDVTVDPITIFGGAGDEYEAPPDLADLDAWSVEYKVTLRPTKLW